MDALTLKLNSLETLNIAEAWAVKIVMIVMYLHALEDGSIAAPDADLEVQIRLWIETLEMAGDDLLNVNPDIAGVRVWIDHLRNHDSTKHIVDFVYTDRPPPTSDSQLAILDASTSLPGRVSQHLYRSVHSLKAFQKNPKNCTVRGGLGLLPQYIVVWMNNGNPISIRDIVGNPQPSWLGYLFWHERMDLPEMDREKGSFYLEWRGYFERKHKQCQFGTDNQQLTRGKLLLKTAETVIMFYNSYATEQCDETPWKVGAGHLRIEDLYLFGLRRVSKAGFEPMLLVKREAERDQPLAGCP